MIYAKIISTIKTNDGTIFVLVEEGDNPNVVCISLPSIVNEEVFVSRVKQAFQALEQKP